ncbi:MAG: hypothetical protein J6U41_08245 [Lachnospiraceae bacterium]|nr:hypothetical protein [Lachnospiraceae bacterium]MBP5472142.1 hypothetical protein [Lachnospiraceae bacterium]MBP5762504.1 hypothetical protein [Lachnospiraceae bacterium]
MRNKMNLPDDNERNLFTPQMTAALVVTAFVTLLIIVIVLLVNRSPHHTANAGQDTEPAQTVSPVIKPEETPSGDVIAPGDLDFWDMYPEDNEDPDDTQQSDPDEEKPVEPDEGDEPPEATDGRHTLVINRDGKEEWMLISPYLPKNDIDPSSLVLQSDLMSYYIDGKETSYLGISVDKYDDYIDFVKLKDAGIDFVMLRVGVRGYESGSITFDDYYADNISRATQAGLEVGLYFRSQAITPEEAAEEAVALISAIGEYNVKYPLAIDAGFVLNDTSRIEMLSKAEKTNVLRAFADTVKASGYSCALHADKEFLLKEIDLSKFSDIDIWLDNPGDLPDYPYAMTMWEYTDNATLNGVNGLTDITISFIDYTQK